jgi:hypothetical protein
MAYEPVEEDRVFEVNPPGRVVTREHSVELCMFGARHQLAKFICRLSITMASFGIVHRPSTQQCSDLTKGVGSLLFTLPLLWR